MIILDHEIEVIDVLAIIQAQRRETELVSDSAVSAIRTTHWLLNTKKESKNHFLFFVEVN